MSFLWRYKRSKDLVQLMPSPTYTKVESDRLSRTYKKSPKTSARRMSLFAPFGKKKTFCGSMTLEAALLLPLFLFFFLHLMGYVEMLRLHSKMSFALWNAGNQLTVYSTVTEDLEMDIPDVAVSYLYVRNSVNGLLGKEYLDTSPIVYGSDGLNYLSADYDGNCVDIGVTYQVAPQMTLFPFSYMRLVNRYYGRVWDGYDVTGEDITYVYVTIYGEVWHKTADCTYIFIDIRETQRSNIGSLQNKAGNQYRLCELCEDEDWQASVYYTPQGDCYHKDRKCSSLVRYIRAIEWQENMAYRACSRCVGKEE